MTDSASIIPGKHAVIVGQNGSGKSQQLITLAQSNRQPTIIMDTKLDDDFLKLAKEKESLLVANNYRDYLRILKSKPFDYLVVRPQKFELSEPKALDNYLDLLNNYKSMTVCIDEAYPFHSKGGRCFEGLQALLTRGRSRKLSVIACTQRPNWVSSFIFSESSYFFIYKLTQLKDRKTVADMIPYDKDSIPPTYQYFYYTTLEDSDVCELKEPVKLFKPVKNRVPTKISLLGFKAHARN